VAQYLPDEVVAYFGVPQAHDDDAQRSIRAGLRLHDALRARGAAWTTGSLAVRVGIHTGLAVVGEGKPDRPGLLAVGEPPLVAARLAALATPGTVVISAATAHLVEGYFTWQVWEAPDPRSRWRLAGSCAGGRLLSEDRLTQVSATCVRE
jgi:class 3 adenylate cyclase